VGLGLIAVQPGGDAEVGEALVGCAVASWVGVDVSWMAPEGLTCVGVEIETGAWAGVRLWHAASKTAKAMRSEIFFMKM
jgi:hypothetical protein